MMTEFIRELAIIKRTDEITSKQVLAWARIEVQMAQKALIGATKQSKEFNAVKRQKQKNNALYEAKAGRREACIIVITVEMFVNN